MAWRAGLVEHFTPKIDPGVVHPVRKPLPIHPNGIVVFVFSSASRDGWLVPIFREVSTQRAVLCYKSAEEACPALEELAGRVVCIVSERVPSTAMSNYLRKEGCLAQLRSLPLIALTRDDSITKKAAMYGTTIITDVMRLSARILSMPTLPAIRSEGSAGLFQGQLVDIDLGDESTKGTDWVFSDNRQWLLQGMHASRMPWYPRCLGYDDHISKLSAYMQALQPVHRCAPATFLAILREGGLMSRTQLVKLFGDSDDSEAIKNRSVMRIARHVRLQEIARDSRFASVKRYVYKYAEAKCNFACATDDEDKARAASLVDKHRPRGLKEEDLAFLDEVVDEVIEDVQKSSEGAVTGIGYAKDAQLGTVHHVFSTLGPNRGFHYGSVVLILNPNLMYHPDTWISPLAATGYMGPHFWVFRHRPWSGAALTSLTGEESNGDGYEDIADTPESEEKGVEACLKSSLNMGACEGWSLIMAREIDAMCHYLSFDHREAYAYDDGTSGMARHGLDWRVEDVRKESAEKLMDDKKLVILPDAWQQVVKYYETKDSHTLYESHLPSFVPLGAIEKICISSDLYETHTEIKDKVDKFVMPDERPLKDLMVITKTAEECMQWQHDWFDARRKQNQDWQSDWYEARQERVNWEAKASRSSIAAERERCLNQPISVRMMGRAGRPCFLPPDISYWCRRFKQNEYSVWRKNRSKDLSISFASRAWHDIRIYFSSTSEPQKPDANLKDEKWAETTYTLCIGSQNNSSAFIAKGILGTRHVVHISKEADKRCTGCGDTDKEGLGVWERYWFSVHIKDNGGLATVSCGKGNFGENVVMSYDDNNPIKDLKYVGLGCWNAETVFCDLVTEWPYD